MVHNRFRLLLNKIYLTLGAVQFLKKTQRSDTNLTFCAGAKKLSLFRPKVGDCAERYSG